MSLRLRVERLRGGRLLDDYLAGRPELAPFYAGHPHELDAYRGKLREVRTRFPDVSARARAAAALTPTTPRARERMERFVREGGAMVTTGQQAGLFGGPLYTVHKALTAVRLAEALERELDTVVLPVFWIASEDHDFAEVNHAHAVDSGGELRRVRVTAAGPAPLPMSRTRLAADVEEAARAYLEAVGADPADPRLREGLLGGYRAGESVADAFLHLVLDLFSDPLYGGIDLCVTRADHPELKAASVPVLLREAERAAEHQRIVAEQTARLERAGYPAQVALVEGSTSLFLTTPEEGRERLDRDGEDFVADGSGRRLSPAALERQIREHPASVSPNALLRPVVESAVFPTLAYVGGAAEIAYWGQVRPLFHAFGMEMPVLFPRWAATLIPEEVEEEREALGLEEDELRHPEHELLERLARERLPAEVGERLAALRRALVEGFGGVMDATHGIDRNLDRAIGGRRDRAMLEAARAERTVLRHFKQRSPELARGLRRVRNHLRPLGVPQERVLTVLQYLLRRPSLLRELAAAMTVELGAAAAGRG